MADGSPAGPTDGLTPEQEEVRRLLADARHAGPMPDMCSSLRMSMKCGIWLAPRLVAGWVPAECKRNWMRPALPRRPAARRSLRLGEMRTHCSACSKVRLARR